MYLTFACHGWVYCFFYYGLKQIPLNDIPEAVYKTSTDWIKKRSSEALGTFILWSLDTIFADLAIQQGPAKGSKKVAPQGSSKAQVNYKNIVCYIVIVKYFCQYMPSYVYRLPLAVWKCFWFCPENQYWILCVCCSLFLVEGRIWDRAIGVPNKVVMAMSIKLLLHL